jgi:hypothetical protein
MANTRWKDKTELTTPDANDRMPITDAPTASAIDKYVTPDNLSKAINASNVPNTPAGGISSTNIQAAINELDTDKVGTSETATLTNKDIDADNNTISNIGATEIESGIITGQSEKASPTTGDFILATDGADSNNLKKVDVGNLPGGAVDSVFGRTGAVVAVSDDYTASQITNVATGNIVATDVQAAINELDTEKSPIAGNSNLVTVGTITSGVWNGTAIDGAYVDIEGTEIKSTGEVGGVKFLREDGDGTCSWQTPAGSGDVSKVGTPVDNQVGVWTGDGTIEGTSGLTYDGSNFQLTGDIGSTGTRITKGWFTDLESTNVPTVGGTALPTSTSTTTLTNKRITKRVGTTTSSATPTINTDNVDYFSITALAVDITSMTTNLSGTPTDAQSLWISIVGTATRSITWGASFESSDAVQLPTTTNGTERLDVAFIWNAVTSKWRCVASTSPKLESFVIAISDETTALTTGTAKATFRMPYAFTLTDVRASLTGAGSTSGTTTFDINEGGTTILSTKLTIDNTEKTSTTAATPAVISDSSLADDAEITIDIDAVTGGADETGGKITLIGYKS